MPSNMAAEERKLGATAAEMGAAFHECASPGVVTRACPHCARRATAEYVPRPNRRSLGMRDGQASATTISHLKRPRHSADGFEGPAGGAQLDLDLLQSPPAKRLLQATPTISHQYSDPITQQAMINSQLLQLNGVLPRPALAGVHVGLNALPYSQSNVLVPSLQPYIHPQTMVSSYAPALLNQPSVSSPLAFDSSAFLQYQTQETTKIDPSACYNVFVGDLGQDVDNNVLQKAFRKFGQIAEAKVIRDQQSLKSRGYGFVSFIKQEDAQRAIDEMNGQTVGKRAVRTNWATRKNNETKRTATYEEVLAACDGENTSVYLGNIGPDVSEADIREQFNKFGAIKQVRMFTPKNYGFVVFDTKENAAKAIHEFSGQDIRGHTITCSWGKLSDQTPKLNPVLVLNNLNKLVGNQLGALPLVPGQLYSSSLLPGWL